MTKKKKPSRPARGVEWVGGIVQLPAYITGEGEPYRPEALLWLNREGAVLGSTVVRPGEPLGLACESLQSAIERPMYPRARTPARVRVASAELAEVLRSGHPSLEVVCAPTPELDEFLAVMWEKMGEGGETAPSYLSSGVAPEAVASFFRAAAGLFRARPWQIVPNDHIPLSVTIEALGLQDAVISVIGQMGESLGLVLFPDIEHYDAFLAVAEDIEQGEEPLIPPHLALNFVRGAELDAEERKEIAQHDWEVAGADGYPRLLALDPDLVLRPLSAGDLAIAEAVALALAGLIGEQEQALRDAFQDGEPLEHTRAVRTHAGEVEVKLRAPHEPDTMQYRPPYDVLAHLRRLGRREDGVEDEEREALEDELVRRFACSPEAGPLEAMGACRFVMQYAADHLGATIATLDPEGLREIIFEIVPRKVSTDPSDAREIIEEMRAFYTFLERAHGLKQAKTCLRVLGGDAVNKLEAALSDPRNFGMAKSLVMAGHDAGYDVGTEEGLREWMRVVESGPLPDSIRLPSIDPPFSPPPRAAARQKKNRRKASRKSRKKNR